MQGMNSIKRQVSDIRVRRFRGQDIVCLDIHESVHRDIIMNTANEMQTI